MNLRIFVLVGFTTTLLLMACQRNSQKEQIKAIAIQETEYYGTFESGSPQSQESKLNAGPEVNRAKGLKLIETYSNFSTQYPNDTLSAMYLYKAGEIAMNLKLSSQSILYFDKIITNFPSFSKAPECLFLKAFIFDDQVKDYDNAGKYYNEFIAKYPNHALIKDAKASLEYLGKSPEELVKMFQEKNQIK
jgi:tetratricopeptide (TPR) repeat protein